MSDAVSRQQQIMRSTIPVACLAIASLLSTACSVGRPVHYYAIEPLAAAAPPVKPDGLILVVGRIVAPEALQDNRIRYRAGADEVGAYEYQRWAERPGAMVRDLLTQTLRASGRYRQVQETTTAAAGDYLVRGKLYEFSEVDDPGIATRVYLQLDVVASKTGLVVWSKNFRRDEPVDGKAMKDVVLSLDHNLRHVIADADSGIDSFLSNPK